jgi:hypothetical protein
MCHVDIAVAVACMYMEQPYIETRGDMALGLVR